MYALPGSPVEKLDSHHKALRVNLDGRRYGTFAEIGAGQEVVRWFFRAGAAAGTIAKSMSAYDMAVSDAIYGPCQRYVSRGRLQSMLDYEHALNLSRLAEQRGDTTAFFTFADTVAARSFRGTNECHAWMGVKFQAHPRDQDSQIVVHVRMLDTEAAAQQEALGIIGVNLLYGAFFLNHEPELLVETLLDNLSRQRIEIDMVEFSGIAFRHVDNRLISLKLVQIGLTDAAMFSATGDVLQPSEVLHKRAILVERGRFRPVTHVNVDMLRAGRQKMAVDSGVAEDDILPLMEITMQDLSADGTVDTRDFLARADVLATTGCTVLVSNYLEYYRLAAYLRRHSREPMAIAMGAASLRQLMDEKYYAHLDGGILESFGRMFKNDLKLYIYPSLQTHTQQLMTVHNLEVAPELGKLYGYLCDRQDIVSLDNYHADYLPIYSDDVLQRIRRGDPSWLHMVPESVAEIIQRRHLFGWRSPAAPLPVGVTDGAPTSAAPQLLGR